MTQVERRKSLEKVLIFRTDSAASAQMCTCSPTQTDVVHGWQNVDCHGLSFRFGKKHEVFSFFSFGQTLVSRLSLRVFSAVFLFGGRIREPGPLKFQSFPN